MNSTLGLLGEHSIDRDIYQALHCVPIPDFYARVLGRSLTDDEWATAEVEFMRSLSQRRVRLRNGAQALLTHLHDSGYTQSLLSLLPHTRLLAETAETGVTHLFDRIDGRRAPGTTKAQALAAHLEAMGRPPDGHHDVLLIGDTRDDALAARTVGAHIVLVTGGLENAASLHQSGAAVADDLAQAVALGLRLVPHGTRGTAIAASHSSGTAMSSEDNTSAAHASHAQPVGTPTDPAGHYVHGRAVLDLTDRLNAAASYEEAAQLANQVLEPTDGLLERLAEFFEAAAEKANESEREDRFDLHDDLQEAAATVRALGEDLHVVVDRIHALASPPRLSWQPGMADPHATTHGVPRSPAAAPPSSAPAPGRTR